MQKVKKLVIGVGHRVGVAKTSGRPYDMCQMLTGVENAPQRTQSSTYDGVGYQTRELECDASVIDQLRAAGVQLPAICELSIDARLDDRGNARAVVVGAELVRASVVSASERKAVTA